MSYLDYYLTPENLQETVEKATTDLSHLKFDAIAVSGVSGLLVGAPLAIQMKKNLLVVRKNDDKGTHSTDRVEGWYRGKERILILDDKISSGTTVAFIKRMLHEKCIEPQIVGTYMYAATEGVSELQEEALKFR